VFESVDISNYILGYETLKPRSI